MLLRLLEKPNLLNNIYKKSLNEFSFDEIVNIMQQINNNLRNTLTINFFLNLFPSQLYVYIIYKNIEDLWFKPKSPSYFV